MRNHRRSTLAATIAATVLTGLVSAGPAGAVAPATDAERVTAGKYGRAIFNEVFWLRPNEVLGEIQTPTLIVHGTKDTFVPIESSRSAMDQLGVEHKLVEIEGAQHGFAVHDDPQYLHPQSQQWQAFVVRTVGEWLTG